MRIAFGLKAHSGWAALVALGRSGDELRLVDRRRVELVAPEDARWAKAPYHAAEGLDRPEARALVQRGIEAAHRIAAAELRAALVRAREADHRVAACALLVGSPMPGWTVDEILAVHFRMHKAEGVLFRDALAGAARACRLPLAAIPEKRLGEHAAAALATPLANLRARVAALGKSAGPPWGKDQKEAALAALVALRSAGAQPGPRAARSSR